MTEEINIEELDENQRITRIGTLQRFVRSKIDDNRVSGEAKEVLLSQLEQIAIILIRKSKENANTAGRKTIYPEDFEASYEELLRPHGYLEQVIDTLEKQTEELRTLNEKSALSYMEVDL